MGATEVEAEQESMRICSERSRSNDCVVVRRYFRPGYGIVVKTCDGHPCNHFVEGDYANVSDARTYTLYLCRKKYPSASCAIAEEWSDGLGLNSYEQRTDSLEIISNSSRQTDNNIFDGMQEETSNDKKIFNDCEQEFRELGWEEKYCLKSDPAGSAKACDEVAWKYQRDDSKCIAPNRKKAKFYNKMACDLGSSDACRLRSFFSYED